MKLLFAAAEGSPFVKTGGLADVIGALPQALRQSGADARVILPKYKVIPKAFSESMTYLTHIEVPMGWRSCYCGVFKLELDGIPTYFLDNEYFFGARSGIYGHGDDEERFAFFNRAVLEILPHIGFQPDIIHSHDWHTGMIAPMLHKHYRHNPYYQSIKTVFTIHNLQYQGVFSYSILGDLLGLDDSYFQPGGVEFKGGVSFIKGGINYSDQVTTVSRTYAREIQTEYYGEGLDGALRSLGNRLSGIVNGIDQESYNPATDPNLSYPYRSSLDAKRLNKIALQRELGLEERGDVPLIGMVGRLTGQKGLDLVERILFELMEQDDVQLVVLGSGDPRFEQLFEDAAGRYVRKLAVQIKFDEGLARRIYASSDLFLMPSRFEPCGLSQLIAMRYGSIPIVRETGGLNDTVQSYNEFTGEGNGFSFTNYNAHDMLHTIRRALRFYTESDHWGRLAHNAMGGDYSWSRSADEYYALYARLTDVPVKEIG
ncbi:glycogen synthase GlgA [Paenibacillus sp. GCM10012307]|uniref:Glycogen synthase n=1 Tax=Paenibacillus roseus TaxID=2798579 RepID=A0A934IVQ4_9BACL|nr:glycogen synthase GlgA [Paenibacillus roseus]MBJ6360181.1 glycogen synthase GlgA [Paenibacillus roseus]